MPSKCGRCDRRESRYGEYKRGLNTKIHIAVDSNGMPIRIIITKGRIADCKQGVELIDGFDAKFFIADRGYDRKGIIDFAEEKWMITVMPSRTDRREQRF